MIKRFHEAPKSIFKYVQKATSGDYILVHLLEKDVEYLSLARESVESGREVILDNSIFELGKSFDMDKFAHWVQELKPTWYIIPDSLENMRETCEKADLWNEKYGDLPGKKIGVIQGKSYKELESCYVYLDQVINVDMIAISFDYSYYLESVPNPNKWISYMLGRVKLLGDLEKKGVINKDKPHHLLGVSLPAEGYFYRDYPWIYSVDTSNPVVAAIKETYYKENIGLHRKITQKLVDLIDTPSEDINLLPLKFNIEQFNKYWND